MSEEINNKIILILAVLVVLVVAISTWLTLNKLSSLDNAPSAQAKVVYVTEKIKEGPAPVGKVTLTILPTPEQEGSGA